MDNFSSQEEAELYLRGVGLTVPEDLVRQVVKVVAGEVKSSFRKLYTGNKREGVLPLCGKGTVTKIRNLWQEGRLQPYWDYLGANPGVEQQPYLKPEAAGTSDLAQEGHWRNGQPNDSLPLTPMDWSVIDINVKAPILRELLGRLTEFLELHCAGDLIIFSDQVDDVYIRLRTWFCDPVVSPGLGDWQEAVQHYLPRFILWARTPILHGNMASEDLCIITKDAFCSSV